MSFEIESLWPFVYSDPEKKFSLLEATHTLKGFRESVVMVLISGVKKDDQLSLAIGVATNAFLNAYNCICVSLGRLNRDDDFYLNHASRVIEQQMIKSEALNGVVSRAMYLLNVLPDILGRDPFGIMAGRICSATALMNSGYAPLTLISDFIIFRSGSVKTDSEIAQNISNYFIEYYHHTARSILGDELFVITKIDRVLSRRALEVFGDEVKAGRWLNRPLVRYQNITPSAYARMGNAKEVLEYLIRIEQGYFG